MAAELPRPGVEVIQVFQTVTPTVVTPTLVPCVVGVCKQVVDVLVPTATGGQTINSQALISLNAIALAAEAVGTPPVYAGLDGLVLALSLNTGAEIDITLSGESLSPAQVVATVLAGLSAANEFDYTAEVIGTTQWRLRSLAADSNQSIEVLPASDPAVLAAFGFGAGRLYQGSSGYVQDSVTVDTASFPNPNHNLSSLVIEPESVRAFLFLGGTGSALMELLQTEAFLTNGTGLAATLEGSVDMTTLTFAGHAVMTGTVDVTAGGLYGGGGTLDGKVLTINVDAAGPLTLSLVGTGNAASQVALFAAIEAEWPHLTATLGGSGSNKLVLTDSLRGAGSTIAVTTTTGSTALGLTGTATGAVGTLDGLTLIATFNGASSPLTVTFAPAAGIPATLTQINSVIDSVAIAAEDATTHELILTTLQLGHNTSILLGAGTANTALGLTPGTYSGSSGVQAIANGSGSSLTNLLSFTGEDFTQSATHATIVGSNVYSSVADGHTLIMDDGSGPQTLVFSGASTPTLIKAQIRALFGTAAGGQTLIDDVGSNLRLRNAQPGQSGFLNIIGGTALVELFGSPPPSGFVRGTPFKPQPGDAIWVDGQSYATVVQVTPGAQISVLKIDHQVPVSPAVGLSWFIVAKKLNAALSTSGVSRPTPNLTVDLDTGNFTIKPEIIRNVQGNPVYPALAQVYVQYTALRLDVTSQATSPGLLRFNDTPSLTAQLSPITTDNPLGLGLYFALLNAPTTQVTGLGVGAISGDAPFGTVEAFTAAAAFLEGYEVYGIAPLTNDPTVGQVFQAHVDAMSAPANKGERIVLLNPTIPVNKLDTLVASSTQGNSTPTTNIFDTGIHNLDALLLTQGLPPAGPYLTSDGIFLDLGDGQHYNVVNVSGTLITLKTTGFAPGENDDGYYFTGTFPNPPLSLPLISETFAIRIRGAALVLPDGVTPDLDGIALTMQQMAQAHADRRVWSIVPDQCAATLGGIEQVIPGFYLCAAIVGMIAQQPPQQSFTNFPMTGFTRVIGSNSRFSEAQLNVMAAGGNYVVVQDVQGAPLISRMALTTDMTSIETRTDSVTKVVDFVAKFLRTGLKNFIGRFNITQGFLDSLGHVIHGLLGFLVESGVLVGSNLNNIVQDVSAPDTVLIDVTLDVPFPCNYIQLTLTI